MRGLTCKNESKLNADIQGFIAEFSDGNFRYCNELFRQIAAGTLTLHSAGSESTQPITQLIRVFELRLRRLDRLQSEKFCKRRQSIREDTEALCDGFRAHLNDECELWIFAGLTHGVTHVYVAHKTRTVLGILRALPREAEDGY